MATRERQAITIAPRYQKPPKEVFGGTDVSWRVLCDLYPSAETPEIIMAVVEYCAARHLDPLRKPVHIVPMWQTKLGRQVQVVMQGINELETTAHRTGRFAGNDEAAYGPDETKTFRGTAKDERGESKTVEVTLTYPVSCAVKVYRRVQGEREAFVERVFFSECYGRAGFRSEVPNARWTLAPRQMLAKVAKAASLRLAFPEEVGEYSAEEMEDREIEAGGVTIEGRVDHGDPGLTDRDRRISEKPPSQPPGDPGQGLDEPNGSTWVKNFLAALAVAKTRPEVFDLRDDPRVEQRLASPKWPTMIKRQMEDAVTAALKRVDAAKQNAAEGSIEDPGPPGDDPPPDDWPDDPIRELIAEIETMDLVALNGLATSAAWRAKVRDASEFPPDEDRVNEAITLRKAELSKGRP